MKQNKLDKKHTNIFLVNKHRKFTIQHVMKHTIVICYCFYYCCYTTCSLKYNNFLSLFRSQQLDIAVSVKCSTRIFFQITKCINKIKCLLQFQQYLLDLIQSKPLSSCNSIKTLIFSLYWYF